MANYETLKSAIQQVVKTNGNNGITGALLQQSLLAMINSLGSGYQYVGIATPTMNPGTPDQRVYYIAKGKGTYANFGGISITEDEVVILYYDSSWHKMPTGIASQEKITEFDGVIYTVAVTNKYDPSTISAGKRVNYVYGWLSDDERFFSSDFIPVKPGQKVMMLGGVDLAYSTTVSSYCWFKENKTTAIQGGVQWGQGTIKTVPNDAAFLRFCCINAYIDTIMILVSNNDFEAPTNFVQYGETIGGDSRIELLKEDIAALATDIAGVDNRVKDAVDTIYTEKIYSIFNKDTVKNNVRINYVYGSESTNNNFFASDFIPVVPGQYLMMLGGTDRYSGSTSSEYCWYKENKTTAIQGGVQWGQGTIKTVPNDAAFLRFSSPKTVLQTIFILRAEHSFVEPDLQYLAFGSYIGGENRLSLLESSVDENTTDIFELKKDVYEPTVFQCFDKTNVSQNKQINPIYGDITDRNGVFLSDFIPVKPGQKVMEYGGTTHLDNQLASGYCWFDATKQFRTEGETSWEQGTTKTVPENCRYLRVTNVSSYIDTFMVLVSDNDFKAPANYLAFGEHIGGEPKSASIVNLPFALAANPLFNKTFVSLGDSLSNGNYWEKGIEEITGAKMIGTFSAGGTMTPPGGLAENSMQDRVLRLAESGLEPDFIILENVNDRWFASDWQTQCVDPKGTIDDEPFMVSEYLDYENGYSSSEQAAAGFVSNFNAIVSMSANKKKGTIVRVKYSTPGIVLTVSGTATSNGVLAITIGSNTYNVTITNGMSAAEIANAIFVYSFPGYSNTINGNAVTITPNQGQQAETITTNCTASGVAITKTTSVTTSCVSRFFIGYTPTQFADISYWVSDMQNLYKCYKGILEFLLAKFPKARVIWWHPTLWAGFPYDTPSADMLNADGSINIVKAQNSSYKNYLYRACKWNRYIAKQVCDLYGAIYVDLTINGGISIYNMSTFHPNGDVHPYLATYKRWAEDIVRNIV